MILVDDKLILFFSFKMPISSTSGLYDFSLEKSGLSRLYTAIEESTYIILKMGTEILRVERQTDIESKSNEKILFRIRKEADFNYILDNPTFLNFSEYNTEGLNDKLWYTINSGNDNKDNEGKNKNEKSHKEKEKCFVNEDYYISKNDFIKFGNIKYIVKDISKNLDNINDEKKEINFDFYPAFQTYYFSESKTVNGKIIECEICNSADCCKENPIVKFCSCNYLHFECLKKKIESNKYIKENDKVKNYYFNNLKCQKCDFTFPLRFKISEIQYELINIETPPEDTYIILESIEKRIFYGYMKMIHVIKIGTDNDIITIGRNKTKNDVIICDPSISKEHAQFIYDKGKILLKNLSKKFGTSVFIRNGINIGNKRIQIQTGKIMFETQRIKYKDFNSIRKKKKTQFPLPGKY